MADLFTNTKNLQDAVAVINEVPVEKLSKLILRVLQTLHTKTPPFSKDEQERLEGGLGLSGAHVSLLLDTITFFFETAVYNHFNVKTFTANLQSIQLSPSHCEVLARAWQAKAAEVLEKFRNRSLYTNVLTKVDWQLDVQLSQNNLGRVKLPTALFDLTVASGPEETKHVSMEFTRAELLALYEKLEIIQSQLDQLA
eukprot:m.243156 g.243156  ORF g.243156 m.243156 type:complete len:197 (-) comp14183_c0_seq1:77-667(-)